MDRCAIRESTEIADFDAAKDFLKQKEGDATRQRPTKSTGQRVLFSELAELVKTDYTLNNYRSAVDIELRFRLHILPFFGRMRATRISEADIDQYNMKRRSGKAKNATINRELATLKRAFRLGIQNKLYRTARTSICLKRTTYGRDSLNPSNFRRC